eukprot:TRINITY_DN16748_c0_g1_i3.p1 TRINITY_DN16748_c0_g1~~TRINITY_DN16748_c0_g1_i3.p1  ORF type:complete len:293 (-),score=57.71 TRINITY_DN16748_c0_g1_i3:38-916(-)
MEDVKEMGVVGSGQMGSGIAQVIALAGITVVLTDVSDLALQNALKLIRSNLSRLVNRAKLSEEMAVNIMEKIRCTTSLKELGSADIIIEAVSENEDLKKRIFTQLDAIAKPSAILASNTSSISINRLASATKRPQQVIGMHFMNPVPVMKLVEIIRGSATSDQVFGTVMGFEKVGVCSQDYPGFIVNRILMPMINEAFYTLYTGVATKEDIDNAMKLGTSHPMGPLQLADLIGLDTCLSVMRVLYSGLGESKYSPCPLLVQYVDAGYLGRKTGEGVYSYGPSSKSLNPKARM